MRHKNLTALALFVALFLLICSGRLATIDASTQMQSALALALTGKLGIDASGNPELARQLEGSSLNFLEGPDGLYYENHDLGAVLLMYPAARVATLRHGGDPQAAIKDPPLLARFGASLTYSIFAAVGCWFLFRFLEGFYGTRRALVFALFFPLCTLYGLYAKVNLDAIGVAAMGCAALFFAGRIFQRPKLSVGDVAGLCAASLIGGTFRLSTLPYLLLGVCLTLLYNRSKVRAKHVITAAVIMGLLILPSLYHNYLVMGSPFRPPTTHPRYKAVGTGDFSGNILAGLYGLLLSPNKGLVIFSPVCALIAALPWVWKDLPKDTRKLITVYGTVSLLYTLTIAKMRLWDGMMSWGPRYLVVIMPFLYFLSLAAASVLWNRSRAGRAVVASAFGLSLLACTAPLFVNWTLAITQFPDPVTGEQKAVPVSIRADSSLPYSHIAVWQGVGLAMQGKPLPTGADVASDPVRRATANFPDLWSARLVEKPGPLSKAAGGGAAAVLLAVLLFASVRLWRSEPRPGLPSAAP